MPDRTYRVEPAPDPMELEAELATRSSVTSPVSRAVCLPSCSSFGNDQDNTLTTIVQPEPDVDVWPQAPAHELEIVEHVLMPPVDDVARAVTPGGAASTMPIHTFINAFKKPLQ